MPRHPAIAWGATALGVASLLWWALSGILLPWNLEPGSIALSGLWWLGIGWAMRPQRRAFGTFTLVVGAFALADAALTAAGSLVPFWAFALFGGPKLPLQAAWTVWLGIELLRGRIQQDTPNPRAA